MAKTSSYRVKTTPKLVVPPLSAWLKLFLPPPLPFCIGPIIIYMSTLGCHTHIYIQCSKSRVHPAPGVYNLAVGSTHFGTCAPGECTLFQSISIHYKDLDTREIRRVHTFESICTRCVDKIFNVFRIHSLNSS